MLVPKEAKWDLVAVEACRGVAQLGSNSSEMVVRPNAFRKFNRRIRRAVVPEGHLIIAQRFSVGSPVPLVPSPEGTTERGLLLGAVSRPFRTCPFAGRNPTLKRRAIVLKSLRDEDLGEFPKGIVVRPVRRIIQRLFIFTVLQAVSTISSETPVPVSATVE